MVDLKESVAGDLGSQLFREYVLHDDSHDGIMRKVWSSTPWIVNAYDGPSDEPRRREIAEWCRDRFGPECWPLHGKPGQWQRGSATIHGWTWFGFDTEAKAQEFLAAWPVPEMDGVS